MLAVEDAVTPYILTGSARALGAPCDFVSRSAGRVVASGVDIHNGNTISVLCIGIFEQVAQVIVTDRFVVGADNRAQRGAQVCSAFPVGIGLIGLQCRPRRELSP